MPENLRSSQSFNLFKGPKNQKSTGLSIFFPAESSYVEESLPYYRNLTQQTDVDFTQWSNFLDEYLTAGEQIQTASYPIIDQDSEKKNRKLNKNDKSELKAKEKFILSITKNGFGKRTSHYDFRVTNRGGKGIIGIVNSPRNGNVSSSFPVFEGDQILISTNKGRVIRTAVKEIRIAGRNTQGVRIIKLTGDEKVVSSIKLDDNLV